MNLTITLPWPHKDLSPNSRVHWRRKAELKRLAKQDAYLLTYTLPTPKSSDQPLRAVFTFRPPDRRKRDWDNLAASLKAAQDGVCAALSIDDSQIKEVTLRWGEIVKGGTVEMELLPLEDVA